ncbi:hypothetical protein [Kriegella aquimaris]|uniref:Sugar transporter n=1 Tax=Kriegella aquimaris TaxID=192904 RepID=A0A1G9IVP5_9FLAO|nr:hypothetical protein [Kriegella aquimaris]SDL29013.1 hypothetical protein SAMN04488514_101290 [Kriegella aquimaris]
MTKDQEIKPPKWFWIVSVLALLWNIMGVMAYLKDAFMSVEDLEKLTQAERLLYESQPAWATAAFAIAVWGGTLGCIALLLRKKWARPVFLISLIGIVVQLVYAFFLSNSFEVYGPGAVAMPIIVALIGILLVFFSGKAQNKGWIY